MIRTGKQYLDSIRDGRVVYINGERVKDVPTHPMFKPLVDIRARRKIRLIPLAVLREERELADMAVLRRGNRLSITPVSAGEWEFITKVLLKAAR